MPEEDDVHRLKLTQQQVQDLRAGTDQDGRPRTWQEVADHLGRSRGYVTRVARGGLNNIPPLPKVMIDPRDVIPELKKTLTDQDVERWNDNPYCLCGCEVSTLQERGLRERVPQGAYRLFKGTHEKRMPWVAELTASTNREAERRRRQSLRQRENNVRAAFIAELVMEWQVAGLGTWPDLLHRTGMSPNHLRDILHGRYERINKRTAARILAAIGEPLRPELAEEFERWRYETWLYERAAFDAH